MDDLYIKTPQYRYGPLKRSDAKWLIEEGLSTGQDLLWSPKKQAWVRLGNIKDFKPYFERAKTKTVTSKVVAVASGKGGVGKTAVTASLGIELGRLGKKVVVVDADFGGPDLHEWVGVSRPIITINTFFQYKDVNLEQLLVGTPFPNVQLIGGEIGNLAHANPRHMQREKFFRQLHKLTADYVLVDMSPGVSFQTIDLFLSCDEGIIITIPDPTSFMDAFNFIRAAVMRKLQATMNFCDFSMAKLQEFENWDWQKYETPLYTIFEKIQNYNPRAASIFIATLKSMRLKLVTNMIYSDRETRDSVAFCQKIDKLLMVNLRYLGHIDYNNSMRQIAKEHRPFALSTPEDFKEYPSPKISLNFPLG